METYLESRPFSKASGASLTLVTCHIMSSLGDILGLWTSIVNLNL
jgi:hypothetical protein